MFDYMNQIWFGCEGAKMCVFQLCLLQLVRQVTFSSLKICDWVGLVVHKQLQQLLWFQKLSPENTQICILYLG